MQWDPDEGADPSRLGTGGGRCCSIPGTTDAYGTAARILKSSLSAGSKVYMELLHLCFLPLSSSPAHPACRPPPAPSPFPPLLSGFAHPALPRSDLLFSPGLHLKALLMPLGANMKRVSLRLPSADGDLGSIHVLFSTGE